MDHQRFKLVAPEGTTLYIGGFGIFVELFQSSSGNRWNEYLVVGKMMVGVRFLFPDETVTTRYFHHDHLGSIAVITSESGAVVERSSHDAWGKRRLPNGDDDTTGSVTSLTTQGFTGQEELTGFGLVHLNGRVYDPLVARMMSADPLVPEPLNGQAWNRYSYVINNPLAYTDPSGYSWLSDFFHTVQNLFRSVPIIGTIVKIAAAAACYAIPGCAPFVALVAVATSAAVAGITTGRLDAALQAGLVTAATIVAFDFVGGITSAIAAETGGFGFGSPAHIFNIAGHAAVGCGSSVASGGGCGSGALSAGVAAFAGPVIPTQNSVARLVVKTVVGGVASVAAGGSFANGAITAAFGYLFNEAAHQSLREPGQNELVIVINNNGMIGTHAGMFVGDRLYDPGGSYMNYRMRTMSGEDRDNFQATLNDYVEFHRQSGDDIRIFRYNLADGDMKSILLRTDQIPGDKLFCANAVQSCIAGIGPFRNLSAPWPNTMTFPSTLANRLQYLQQGGLRQSLRLR